MTKKFPGVKRLPSGGIEYRGTKFAGFNKPKRSNRSGKKGMVLAKEGDKVKLIHYGDSSMGHNYSPEARKSFKARHAKNIKREKCLLHTGQTKNFGVGRESQRSLHQNLRSL